MMEWLLCMVVLLAASVGWLMYLAAQKMLDQLFDDWIAHDGDTQA